MSDVARQMQRIREARGLSREEVARRLKTTKIRVWRMERGVTKIDAALIPDIAEALKTTIAALYRKRGRAA